MVIGLGFTQRRKGFHTDVGGTTIRKVETQVRPNDSLCIIVLSLRLYVKPFIAQKN
jgi:hypothetical protein